MYIILVRFFRDKEESPEDVCSAITESSRLPNLKSNKTETDWKHLSNFEEATIENDYSSDIDFSDNKLDSLSIKSEEHTQNKSTNSDAANKFYEDEKELTSWIPKDCLEKLDGVNFACEYCPTVCNLEEEIINHVKTMHAEKADILRNFDSNENGQQNKKERRKPTKIDQVAVNAAKVIVEGEFC